MITDELTADQVHALIRRHRGRTRPLRDLPPAYQLAIVEYMSLSSGLWTPPDALAAWLKRCEPPGVCSAARRRRFERALAGELPKHLPYYLARQGDHLFGRVTIPLATLARFVEASDVCGADEDWEAYHRWYVRVMPMPSHNVTKPLWPVWLNTWDPLNVLDDGWHRLHDYARKGVQRIPAVYFPLKP